MGYSSVTGMAALRMARIELSKVALDDYADAQEIKTILTTIQSNLKIADKEGLSPATRDLWKMLREFQEELRR